MFARLLPLRGALLSEEYFILVALSRLGTSLLSHILMILAYNLNGKKTPMMAQLLALL